MNRLLLALALLLTVQLFPVPLTAVPQERPQEKLQEGPRLLLEAPPGPLHRGESFQLILTLLAPGHRFLPPLPKLPPGLILLDRQLLKRSPGRMRLGLRLLAMEEGELTLEPLRLALYDAEGEESHIRSEPLKLTVLANRGAGLPQGLEPPLPRPYDWWPLLIALGLAPLAWILAGASFQGSESIGPLPRQSPTAKALAALKELAESDLHQAADSEPFFLRLSLILRDFLEGGLGFKALEQTTAEFAQSLKSREDLSPEDKSLLEEFLRLADRIKFGRFQIRPEDGLSALSSVRGFVASAEKAEQETQAVTQALPTEASDPSPEPRGAQKEAANRQSQKNLKGLLARLLPQGEPQPPKFYEKEDEKGSEGERPEASPTEKDDQRRGPHGI